MLIKVNTNKEMMWVLIKGRKKGKSRATPSRGVDFVQGGVSLALEGSFVLRTRY